MKHLIILLIFLISPGLIKTQTPKTVKIGNQVWMSENLGTTIAQDFSGSHFKNGDPITYVVINEEWEKAANNKQPAWCYYDNDPANGPKYGKLYNWYAVAAPQSLCPTGWHVPSDAEWRELEDFLGKEIAGKYLKNSSGWNEGSNGTNQSGFTALPGGGRLFNGSFFDIGQSGYWWNSSEATRGINYADDYINDGFNGDPSAGYSVRCIKD